ncbi:uncharacterized protein LOC111097275 [Canis lupus familiaris]|uniref:uncharacterized protein LOC111097275 n=1 Tax=Canis lupus familiaris TaxID=9615 RepID=UPI000BA9FEE1|nr:uncharacterized protein LOC111097275 [Canis lupus familiaris]XP_035576396.1 uncharacterized protein LOC112672888 [Canis lupus dingo]XP_038402340.1 uncharacterized protein LOC111097275 [Canis lupus familiaris]XP_038402341.1 uncharacterized protein LOC111097275 [Canis lupus familiaris]XP_038480035.1 uncharacterized protein LOC111097275 [Canis lupus familiaris]XP_038531463.1 uncharacterized protein LOC111097275 [Canis lupus familiaris]XP_038531464.1 uncharacterized protein LOC111097275 [Canis|eukprot:XP_022278363.1 uncharacterized protein LOC111097275 [Canis lupus familiaris]
MNDPQGVSGSATLGPPVFWSLLQEAARGPLPGRLEPGCHHSPGESEPLSHGDAQRGSGRGDPGAEGRPGGEAETSTCRRKHAAPASVLMGFPGSRPPSPQLQASPAHVTAPSVSGLAAPLSSSLTPHTAPGWHVDAQVSGVSRVLQPSSGRPHVASALTPVLPSPLHLSPPHPRPRDPPCYKALPGNDGDPRATDVPTVRALTSGPQREVQFNAFLQDRPLVLTQLGAGFSRRPARPAVSTGVAARTPSSVPQLVGWASSSFTGRETAAPWDPLWGGTHPTSPLLGTGPHSGGGLPSCSHPSASSPSACEPVCTVLPPALCQHLPPTVPLLEDANLPPHGVSFLLCPLSTATPFLVSLRCCSRANNIHPKPVSAWNVSMSP